MDVWIQLETIPPEIGTIESLELLNVASNKMTSLPNLDGYLAHAHKHTQTTIHMRTQTDCHTHKQAQEPEAAGSFLEQDQRSAKPWCAQAARRPAVLQKSGAYVRLCWFLRSTRTHVHTHTHTHTHTHQITVLPDMSALVNVQSVSMSNNQIAAIPESIGSWWVGVRGSAAARHSAENVRASLISGSVHKYP